MWWVLPMPSKAMFGREGFDLGRFREELAEKGKESSLDTLRDEIIGMNIFNSVFVDCTASAGVASLYKDLLMHNVSVVAANKIAASSEYENYRELKQIARQRGVKYLFETMSVQACPSSIRLTTLYIVVTRY